MIKALKFALLALTLWPIVYAGIFLSGRVSSFLPFNILVIFHLGSAAIGMGLWAYFVHLYNNVSVNGQSKMKWFIGFILTGPFAMAFYWKKHIW
jgi:hypothetical protein